MENTKPMSYWIGYAAAIVCIVWGAITILALPIAAIKYIFR